MFEIIASLSIYFLLISTVLLIWKMTGVVRRGASAQGPLVVSTSNRGERSAHSNLSLATIGILGFFIFPLLLVGVRWSLAGEKIGSIGYLEIMGFLLTGVVSYLYFVRSTKGENS